MKQERQSGEWGTIVRRIKRRRRTSGVDWRTIVRRIKSGKCTPIISFQVSSTQFNRQDQITESWANEVEYPLMDTHNLHRVAQYASISSRDSLSPKEDFLEFLKYRLLNKSRQELPDEAADFLDELEEEMYELTFSEVATRLGHPRYDSPEDDPLQRLAELPLPIYLTTNYCTFMENALRSVGKDPYTAICYWHDTLDEGDFKSVFTENPDYVPTVEQPVVFHLHGLDAVPSSLVLTEDDYMDFLIKIAADQTSIPPRIMQALSDTSLLLLGYQLNGWDFKTLFRGLITSKRANRRLLSLSIQYQIEEEDITNRRDVVEYLKNYFYRANFDVYWGDTQNFMRELWEHWETER